MSPTRKNRSPPVFACGSIPPIGGSAGGNRGRQIDPADTRGGRRARGPGFHDRRAQRRLLGDAGSAGEHHSPEGLCASWCRHAVSHHAAAALAPTGTEVRARLTRPVMVVDTAGYTLADATAAGALPVLYFGFALLTQYQPVRQALEEFRNGGDGGAVAGLRDNVAGFGRFIACSEFTGRTRKYGAGLSFSHACRRGVVPRCRPAV